MTPLADDKSARIFTTDVNNQRWVATQFSIRLAVYISQERQNNVFELRLRVCYH